MNAVTNAILNACRAIDPECRIASKPSNDGWTSECSYGTPWEDGEPVWHAFLVHEVAFSRPVQLTDISQELGVRVSWSRRCDRTVALRVFEAVKPAADKPRRVVATSTVDLGSSYPRRGSGAHYTVEDGTIREGMHG